MLLEMFFLNVSWQETKRMQNSDMRTLQIQIIRVKQDQILKEDLAVERVKYTLHDYQKWVKLLKILVSSIRHSAKIELLCTIP